MKVVEAEEWAIKDIKRILKNAGLIEGEFLDLDQIKSETAPIFWHKKIDSLDPTNKKIYVIWDLPSLSPNGFADDRVALRNIYVSIDIFTKLDGFHKEIKEVLKKINTSFEEEGWRFEKVAFDSIDRINSITQIRYSATRNI